MMGYGVRIFTDLKSFCKFPKNSCWHLLHFLNFMVNLENRILLDQFWNMTMTETSVCADITFHIMAVVLCLVFISVFLTSNENSDAILDISSCPSLWLAERHHVTWVLASDWLRVITWPGDCPLIGWEWSRDLETVLWLVTPPVVSLSVFAVSRCSNNLFI